MEKRGNELFWYINTITFIFVLFLLLFITSESSLVAAGQGSADTGGSCGSWYCYAEVTACGCYNRTYCQQARRSSTLCSDRHCGDTAPGDATHSENHQPIQCASGYYCEGFGSHTHVEGSQGRCVKAYCSEGLITTNDAGVGGFCLCGGTNTSNTSQQASVGQYCCSGRKQDKECDFHEAIHYTWYTSEDEEITSGEVINYTGGTNTWIADGDTGSWGSGSHQAVFSGIWNIIDSLYSLCSNNDYLCGYMMGGTNTDHLSNYYIFFEFPSEFENPDITYTDSPRSPQTFGVTDTFVENLDYRNASVNFCDPDATSSFCGSTCKLGYDLDREGKSWGSRIWDSETNECCGDDYNRMTIIKPDFLYGHVDEPDFSKKFCESCPLGIDLDTPNKRVWDDIARCCGDDDGNWYQFRNLTGELGGGFTDDGFDNKHDCAKLVYSGEYLCNFHRTEGETKSKWYNAVDDPGEIAYIPCISFSGFEAVSNGQTWIGCGIISPPQDKTHQFTGEFFEEEKRIMFEDGWKHSYFCISPPAEEGIDTIYECCGTRACKSSSNTDPDGGLQTQIGYAFDYGVSQKDTFYCAHQTDINPANGKVISSGATASTLWSTDLDLTNKANCESAENPENHTNAGFTWTGKNFFHIIGNDTNNFCCSENDDNDLPYEFYNDPAGIGACFSSIYQPNNNFVHTEDHLYNEIYVLNGSIHGCAIDDYAAISNHCSGPHGNCTGYAPYIASEYYAADTNKPYDGSFPGGLRNENNFLTDLNNWPNPAKLQKQGNLVEDHSYCDMIDFSSINLSFDEGNNSLLGPMGEEIGKYYCSYEEIWKETEGKELTHLSFTEWGVGEGKKRAECCLPDECWNGEECIQSQHANPLSPPFESNTEGYRCIFGEWYYSLLKQDWNNIGSGWCPHNDQCMVSPSGQYENYNYPQCITSREFIGDNYCENGNWTSRTKLLALQLLSSVENVQKYTLYCDNYQETLNTLNYTIFAAVEDYITNQRQPRSGMQPFNSVNNFCILRYGENDDIAIATSLNHPIYLSDPTNVLNLFEEQTTCPTETNGFEICGNSNTYYNSEINSIIHSKGQISFIEPQQNILIFFKDMFDFIFGWQPEYGFGLNYDFIQDTTDFKKVYVSNQEQIVAVTEKVWPSTNKEYISVKYSGIGADICNTIEIYDDSLGEENFLQCEESMGTHYIISGLPDGINLWSQLTSKLRPKP